MFVFVLFADRSTLFLLLFFSKLYYLYCSERVFGVTEIVIKCLRSVYRLSNLSKVVNP